MLSKFIKKILLSTSLLLLAALFSCNKNVDQFLLSPNPQIRHFELHDHNVCVALKVNIDGKANELSPYYWRCRLAFAKYRIAYENPTPLQEGRNMQFGDLFNKIAQKISSLSESFLLRETRKIDNHHHNQCLNLGFKFETDNQAEIDEYFFCRRALIEEQQKVPAFGKQDFLAFPNKEYDLTFAVNQRIDQNLKLFKSLQEKYPACVKYNIYSENFKRCSKAEDNSRQCYSAVPRQTFKKEWERKIKCQKQAYTRYSDELLKDRENLSQKESKMRNQNSDFFNKNSLSGIGASEKNFVAKEKLEEMEKQEKELKKEKAAKKTNSKLELYDKYELTKLRQQYIFACQTKSNDEIYNFDVALKNACEDLRKFEILGDEK